MPAHDAPIIDSPANPRIRQALRLRDRRERDETGLTLVDGGRESLRAMEAGAVIETAFICAARIGSTEARRVAEKVGQSFEPFGASIEVLEVSERAFDRLAYGDRSDGVVLVVRSPGTRLEDLVLPASPLIVVTEDVEKPGNVGAILRSADGVGASAVVAVGGTDLYNPNVIRASVGTVFSVPIGTAAGAGVVLEWLRAAAVRIVATRVDATKLHVDADLTGPHCDRARERGERPLGCVARPGRRSGPPADARRGRQPERVGCRSRAPVRGVAPAPCRGAGSSTGTELTCLRRSTS